MNNNNQSICLETIPDEIFLYELFPLFSWKELYHTFFGLNQRFNKILQSTKYLNLIINETNKYHRAVSFFIPSIACLTVCLGQFNITSFSNLHSLTLQYPSLQQRNSIRPENFPFLKYLKLSYPLEDLILLNLIFANAFKYLKQCQFDRTLTDHSWNGSPKLHSLSISVCDAYGTICVLRACPNISRLSLIVYDTSQDNLSLPRHSISCMNLYLQHLFIRSKFEIFVEISKLTPNLKWLTFDDITRNTSDGNPGFNFKLLADILWKLRQLSYLHFTIVTSVRNEHASLHPLFKHVQNGKNHCVVIASDSTIESR